MSSIRVKEESSGRLHLSMEPTATTWAMAFGIFSIVIGYPLYSFDCACSMLLAWTLGTAALVAFFNPWQEVIIDKEKHSLVIDKQNILQRYSLKTSTPAIYELDNIQTVKCECSSIVFTLANFETIELNVKEGSHRLDQLVEKIRNILQLEENQTKLGTPLPESEAGSLHLEAANEDSSSANSDDSFERIDSSDLADYERSKTEFDNDIPSESVQSLSPLSEESKDLPPESEEQRLPSESTPVSLDEQMPESAGDFSAPSAAGSNP